MRFSQRTSWNLGQNPLSIALSARKEKGLALLDLTLSNPTQAGFVYPENLLAPLASSQNMAYLPDPQGTPAARAAIVNYLGERDLATSPSDIVITASTSEAYSFLFRLLCDPQDEVLVPRPSYPLFDFLTALTDVTLQPYALRHDLSWQIDFDLLENAISPATKAILIVSPNNPTGNSCRLEEENKLLVLAEEKNLALIVDEVFLDYKHSTPMRCFASHRKDCRGLVFHLNGISKSLGLPQLKLSWIALRGEAALKEEARKRLEVISDTHLSTNIPVQNALPELLQKGAAIRAQICHRVIDNAGWLVNFVKDSALLDLFPLEGGWYACLRADALIDEEAFAVELLEKTGTYLYPGFYFGFEIEPVFVISLMPPAEIFQQGLRHIVAALRQL